MEVSIGSRLKHAWNAFLNRDPPPNVGGYAGGYVVKSEARREQANKRRQEIEDQLRDSKYGIAWTDGTERVTQLNRSLENNLLKQIEYLTNMF